MRPAISTSSPVASSLSVSALLLAFAFAPGARAQTGVLPADAETARQRLDASPRHGEWIDIEGPAPAGGGMRDSVRAWISYPERETKAPVVIVIQEVFGLTDWIRAVADQLAAEGFIAVAPDLLTGHGPDGSGTPADTQAAMALVRGLDQAEVMRRLSYVADHATALPAATPRFGSVGFCWGGGMSFTFAGSDPDLDAAVVYYGRSADAETIAKIEAPVLGLYGGNDMRVNATIPDADAAMQSAGKSFTKRIYDGAGHGFLRQQDGQEGANATAAQAAWQETIEFFREHLEE
ncbi:MAG TPA: dienelactone hydrolase family protein [Thermoanaerobaculia bacterium]|nr:dienelactone hydrolase family protein [Thermoanaerobaculia bacterium]